MWTCKEGPPDVCLHIWWRRLILPYKVVVVVRCCCSIGSTPTQRARLLSLQDWCLPKKQLHARMMLMLSAVDNTLRASTYSTYEKWLKHENMVFVHTYNWTGLQNYNLILWMILDCISFVSFFAADQISNPKMPKRRELMGWLLMVEKKPSFFASPMGQASCCCYCNCLSMQKSCLTKQTILLLMNAFAVQRCLSFWKSRFYGSFFFENRKLINYFCFTYLPAISFFANSVFLLLLVLTSISFHAIFQHLAFLQPLQKSCLVRLATRQTDRQSVRECPLLLYASWEMVPAPP